MSEPTLEPHALQRTLLQRVQKFVGDGLFRIGVRTGFFGLSRFGWGLSTFSLSGHVCDKCNKRSHTERVHLLHHCTEPDWDNWPRIDA